MNVKPYSQEEKDNAKNKFEDNHCSETMSFDVPVSGTVSLTVLGLSKEQAKSVFSNLSKDEARKKVKEIVDDRKEKCSSLEKIFNSPDKEWERPATNDEYAICLRSNGLDTYQLTLDDKQLNNLQQGINKQTEKIDSLQRNDTQIQRDNTNANTQSAIQSAIEKSEQESKERCQKELTEYNSCLSEYNAKLAEYNTCLNESSDPNSWRYSKYGTSCFKPSSHCFKPICAY